MTPLAARCYRAAKNQETRDWLCQFQWFDCTRIYEMAASAAERNRQAGCLEISSDLHLPAKQTWLEFVGYGQRLACICDEDGDCINVIVMSTARLGSPICEMQLVRGTDKVLMRESPGRFSPLFTVAFGTIVEQLLMIIMQPNLIERVKRNTDKRIVRDITARGVHEIGDFLHWSECKIRGGLHRRVGDNQGCGIEMPLHYRRKHFKPSIGKWIDGFWAGNAAIGIHLKWYSVHPKAKRTRRLSLAQKTVA